MLHIKTGILLIAFVGVSSLPYEKNSGNLDFGLDSEYEGEPHLNRPNRAPLDSEEEGAIESRFGGGGHHKKFDHPFGKNDFSYGHPPEFNHHHHHHFGPDHHHFGPEHDRVPGGYPKNVEHEYWGSKEPVRPIKTDKPGREFTSTETIKPVSEPNVEIEENQGTILDREKGVTTQKSSNVNPNIDIRVGV